MATKRTDSRGKTKKTTTKASAVRKRALSRKKSLFLMLRTCNIGVAIVLFIQAVLIVVLGKSGSIPVVTHFLTPDPLVSQAVGHTVLAQAVRRLFDANLRYIVPAFLIIGALVQLLVATVLRPHYESDVRNGLNRMRWGEFALGGGLVIVTLALISGIQDISLLAAIFSLTALGAVLCYVLELCRGKLQLPSWIVYLFMIFTVVVPWAIIGLYIKGAVVDGSGLPHYVYWADITMFVIFGASASVYYLSGHKKGRWADNVYTEQAFLILNLVGKSAVAWFIFAGLLK